MAENPYYDLMVLLDLEAPEDQRTGVIEQIRSQISSGDGEIKGDADWGKRRLAFEIDHRPEAHYHLFQIQSGTELLEQLDRNLSIEDAVLRHRIIKLPGEPPAQTPRPEPQSAAPVASEAPVEAPGEAEAPSSDEPAAETASEPAVDEPATAPPAEAPAEPAAESQPPAVEDVEAPAEQ